MKKVMLVLSSVLLCTSLVNFVISLIQMLRKDAA